MPVENGSSPIQSEVLQNDARGTLTLESYPSYPAGPVYRLRFQPNETPPASRLAEKVGGHLRRAQAARSGEQNGLRLVFPTKDGRVFAVLEDLVSTHSLCFTDPIGKVTDPETYPFRPSFAIIRYSTPQQSEISAQLPSEKSPLEPKRELIMKYLTREARLRAAGFILAALPEEPDRVAQREMLGIEPLPMSPIPQPGELSAADRVAKSAMALLYSDDTLDEKMRETLTALIKEMYEEWRITPRKVGGRPEFPHEPTTEGEVFDFALSSLYGRLNRWASQYALKFNEDDTGIEYRDPRVFGSPAVHKNFEDGIVEIPVVFVSDGEDEISYRYIFQRDGEMTRVSVSLDGEFIYQIAWRRNLDREQIARVLDTPVPLPNDFDTFSGVAEYSTNPLQAVA